MAVNGFSVPMGVSPGKAKAESRTVSKRELILQNDRELCTAPAPAKSRRDFCEGFTMSFTNILQEDRDGDQETCSEAFLHFLLSGLIGSHVTFSHRRV